MAKTGYTNTGSGATNKAANRAAYKKHVIPDQLSASVKSRKSALARSHGTVVGDTGKWSKSYGGA